MFLSSHLALFVERLVLRLGTTRVLGFSDVRRIMTNIMTAAPSCVSTQLDMLQEKEC